MDERTIAGEPLGIVSSVRVQTIGAHVHVSVWNRGAFAGRLVVDPNDADTIAWRLLASDTAAPAAEVARD